MKSIRNEHDCYVLAHTELDVMLKRYWVRLCHEYDVHCPLFIVDKKDHFDVRYNWALSNLSDIDVETGWLKDVIKQSIQHDYDNGSIMSTNIAPCNGHGITSAVFITYQALMYILETTTASIEFIEYYLRQSLRHEMGHCISNMKYNSESADVKKLTYDHKVHDEYMRYINITFVDDPWLWQLGYYNSPFELAANEAVGLTAEDMVGMDKMLNSYHI